MSSPAAPKKHAPRDPFREGCETVVFVVALVLMLKLFAVEAFVIPTGSMAETLYGYQKGVTCPECGHHYPVNCSNEVSPWNGQPMFLRKATCPNCRFQVNFDKTPAPGYTSGDRVLVHKGMYHWDGGPTRGDVVVFKFPVDPQVNQEAQNYIKRLWGLGGETVAIWRGDLYVSKSVAYPAEERDAAGGFKYPRPDDPRRAWEGTNPNGHSKVRPQFLGLGNDFTYHSSPQADPALAAFEASRKAGFPAGGPFEPLRKTDAQAMAMRRLVYDADHPSLKLAKAGVPARWQPAAGWTTADNGFRHAGGELSFVRYSHRVPAAGSWEQPGDECPPSPITNFLGYNGGTEATASGFEQQPRDRVGSFFVGDLMLEATADVADAAATVVLEVSRGQHRFRASFADGKVTISRAGPGGKELATRPSGFTTGKHRLRFANFDSRLRVWVDGRAIEFGSEADYSPTDTEAADDALAALAGAVLAAGTIAPDLPTDIDLRGFTAHNDLAAPASVGAAGGVGVSELKLWQDTFFTPSTRPDQVDTYYVQPGHYLCLGDNSGQSSDGRMWGLVPERLMLGKACFVFFPVLGGRFGFIQ